MEEGHDGGAPKKKKSFRNYIPSKWRYFYSLRIHLVVTRAGEPVEFSLTAGSKSYVTIPKKLELDLPEGSIICADRDYTNYDYENLLEEVSLHLKAQCKKNSKRPLSAWEEFLDKPIRQYIEIGFQPADQPLPQEDPRSHTQRLRVEDRLVTASLPFNACRRQLGLELRSLPPPTYMVASSNSRKSKK